MEKSNKISRSSPLKPLSFIRYSVGKFGKNFRADVKTVQKLLNSQKFSAHIKADGLCGPITTKAIGNFQANFMFTPDFRVDPGGRTLQKLNEESRSTKEVSHNISLSQSQWQGDSSKWPHAKKLESCNQDFRKKVVRVFDELLLRGFQPKIFFGWRSVEVQRELVRKGRSKVRFSFHNAQTPGGRPNSYAVDIIDKRWAWGAGAKANGFWDALGEAAHIQNIFWGGDWRSFKDVAHIQHLPNFELKRIKRESHINR